tara:strand:+ start:542 stop:802 length:261 start_codon:yes stop_codon:yes gene_type:complete
MSQAILADPQTTNMLPSLMELAIGSGFISGEVDSEGKTWFFVIGSTSVSISSENLSSDIQRAVGVIEREVTAQRRMLERTQERFGL